MKEIEITDEQHEYLESLRDEIKREVVGPYGHVRIVDAVQYLIDNHEGEVDVEVAAEGAVEGVDPDETTDGGAMGEATDSAGDAGATDADPGGPEAAKDELEEIDGIGPSRADALVDAGYESVAAVAGADPEDLAEIDSISEAEAEDIMAGIEANGEDGRNDGGGNQEDGSGGPSAGDGGMLSSMQQLLQEHEDKWTDASDTGYEVELPDGSTESAPTKDDVRALLFRHYN